MLEKHGPLYLNTPGTFVYEDIFKSPLNGRNPCEVRTWKISSWGQGLVTVVRTFLHVRTLWWIQNCYINTSLLLLMFPSPHICLQLSVCLYWWLLARWSSHVCKDQRVCFQLFVGSMFFSGIRDYTVDTNSNHDDVIASSAAPPDDAASFLPLLVLPTMHLKNDAKSIW